MSAPIRWRMDERAAAQPGYRYRLSSRDLWFSTTALKVLLGTVAFVTLIVLVPGSRTDGMPLDQSLVLGLVLGPPVTVLAIVGSRLFVLRIDEHHVSIGTPNRSQYPYPLIEWTNIPIEQVVRFEVRRWSYIKPRRWSSFGAAPSVRLSLLIADGTWRQVDGFARAPDAHGRSRTILGRAPWHRPYRAMRQPDGSQLRWTAGTDQDVEALFNAHLAACRGARPISRAPARVPSWGIGGAIDHHRRTPAVRKERIWLSEALHGRLDSPIVPLPAPPPPPLPPTAPPIPAMLGSSTRLWARSDGVESAPDEAIHDLPLPARYWTLASQRTGSLAGGPPSMTISSSGVTFARRLRRDLHVPLPEAGRFDIAFDAIPMRDPWDEDERVIHGNWRLLLFRTDGSTVPLSGLDHGYFKKNQLFWSTSTTSGRKLPAPEGSMPWPNDQPLVVAARLNAHLEVARRAAGAATTSAGAPAR